MFSSFGKSGDFFKMPLCYHPCTVILVDDDANFTKTLARALSGKLSVLSFTTADSATEYFHNQLPYRAFTTRCLAVRTREQNHLNSRYSANELTLFCE